MYSSLKIGDKELKIYFTDKVYSPEFSSEGTILLANKLIEDGKKEDLKIIDVGCGSGFIGLGIKKFNPFTEVTLTDVDPEALRLTKLNAKRNGLQVTTQKSDLLPKLGNWDLIVANLPTFDEEQLKEHPLHGPEVAYKGDGIKMYQELFKQAKGRCKAIIVECQLKYQPELLAHVTKEWDLILTAGDSFAFMKKPTIIQA